MAKIKKKTKNSEHQLEEFFGIESGTTEKDYYEYEKDEQEDDKKISVINDDGGENFGGEILDSEKKNNKVEIEPHEYDSIDNEITENNKEIYEYAMTQYASIMDNLESVEFSKRPRMIEVANQLLEKAISANGKNSEIKRAKDKLKWESQKLERTPQKNVNNTSNNMFFGSHKEALDLIKSKNKENSRNDW